MPSRRSPDPFAALIGERIRQLRMEKNMSLPELSRSSGISRGHLSDVERGRVVMTIGTLATLARALQIPPFFICLVPKDDPEVAVIDQALSLMAGDPQKTAEELRARILDVDEQNGRDSDD